MADLRQIGQEVLRQNGSMNIKKLPVSLYMHIRRILETENCWRSFISVLDDQYSLPDQVVFRLDTDPRPADSLLLYFSSRQMTIQEFVHYAGQAQIHPLLNLFDVRVPVQIIQQPFPMWNVTVGESLSLEVNAAGSPQPFYQWVKDDNPIPGANGNTLNISSLRVNHSGSYKCQVHNDATDIQTHSIQVSVAPAKPVVITMQPRSYTVSLHGNALLRCEVQGDVNVDYQWMKNGKEVTDNDNVSGSSTNELKIYKIDDADWTGCYCCRISRGEDVLFTQDAVLQVRRGFLLPEVPYKATDKVALLLGVGDYRSELSLRAPRFDVQTLATVFRSLNFKVVSLLDLTKKEMLAAIHEFKYLVGEGVYCVFYFCGHGYEAGSQCFLLPTDVPLGYGTSDCLAAETILFNILLPRKPKICCMILDICRLSFDGISLPGNNRRPDFEYVVCYGTAQGFNAYEKRISGILVSHLKNILLLDYGVEDVFSRLREEIKQDPNLLETEENGEKKDQRPEIRTILSEPNRSFHDEIDSTGYTEVFSARQNAWENSHRKPDSREITVHFHGFDVKIQLDFQAEFSNALTVFTSVIDPGKAKICKAHVCEIPAEVSNKAKSCSIQEGTETSLSQNYLTLHDIQRLETSMVIKLMIICKLHDNSEAVRFVEEDLGMPLVSSLHLNRYHEGEEDELAEYV